jgi:putative acetyltransferase
MEIRREDERDLEQVYALNAAAFNGEDESKLIEKLRGVDGYISFVAVEGDTVIGHISFSPVTLNDEPTRFIGLAPMSVLPGRQKQGIGSRLIAAGLEACVLAGHEAVFVLGHADYYPRLGFTTAADLGFSSEYPVPPEHFMALELVAGSLAGRSGLIKYHPIFAGL